MAMSNDQTDDDGALGRDAVACAPMFSVTAEEAERGLGLQEEIGQLDGQLTDGEAGIFGGLWVEHSPEFKVKVGFTENGTSTLSKYATSSDLGEVIEVVDVTRTLAYAVVAAGQAEQC